VPDNVKSPHLSGAGFSFLGHRQTLDFNQKIVDTRQFKRAQIFLQK